MRFFRGNILPLALVIMTSILLAGIGLGIVVLDSIRRSADTDASMIAYYAADAGVERQLFELRKNAYTVSDLASLSDGYANGSAWSAASTGYLQTTKKQFSSVPKGDFQFIDLFDPDNANAAASVSRVDWSWEAGDDCNGIPPEVEMGYAQWLSGGIVLPEDFVVVRGLVSGGMQTSLDPTRAYRLRFRPKTCRAKNLTVQAYTTPGDIDPMPFPGDITLTSAGTYKKSTQAISVQVPRQDVLSGVFSYVIFSECSLIKDPLNPAPGC